MNDLTSLIQKAKDACFNAYAPYSDFKVGCTIVSKMGNIYSGCNVENVSLGLTICAERVAIFNGISEEGPKFKISQVVIFTPTKKPITPCGACRQVLKEFGDNFEVMSICEGNDKMRFTIDQLLPNSPDIDLQK